MIIDKSSRHDPELAELDVTSNFSFLRGGSHPHELVYRAAELGYAAVAITDLNSLAGRRTGTPGRQGCAKSNCASGARLRFTDAPDVLVWAQNRGGYANLCRLLTTGKRRAEKGSCTLRSGGSARCTGRPFGGGCAAVASIHRSASQIGRWSRSRCRGAERCFRRAIVAGGLAIVRA